MRRISSTIGMILHSEHSANVQIQLTWKTAINRSDFSGSLSDWRRLERFLFLPSAECPCVHNWWYSDSTVCPSSATHS